MDLEQVKLLIEESKGEILMVSARPINGGKYSVEFAQKLRTETNVLGILNEGDSRFNQGGRARRAWMSVEPSAFQKQFKIDLEDAETEQDDYGREVVVLGVSNPTITNPNTGQPVELSIQITESTDIDAIYNNAASKMWALENPDKSIKQDGERNGLYVDNLPIYSKAEVVAKATCNHTILNHTTSQKVGTLISAPANAEENAVDVMATVE